MSWVRQYHVGDEVQIISPESSVCECRGVVAVVDTISEGILVHVDIGGGDRCSGAFFRETDIRHLNPGRTKRPISPIFTTFNPRKETCL